MLDLDAAKKVEDYKIKFQGKEYTFDTLELIATLTSKAKDMTTPAGIREGMSKIFGLQLSTCDALLILRDFETFSDNFDEQVKNLFGHQPSSSTTTESSPTTSDSTVEPVTA